MRIKAGSESMAWNITEYVVIVFGSAYLCSNICLYTTTAKMYWIVEPVLLLNYFYICTMRRESSRC